MIIDADKLEVNQKMAGGTTKFENNIFLAW